MVLSLCTLASRARARGSSGSGRAWLRPAAWPAAARVALEFSLIVLPPLLTLTVAAQHTLVVVAAQVAAAIVLHGVALALYGAPLLRWEVGTRRGAGGAVHALWLLVRERRRSFISNFRSGMMLLTCISILAVDFRVFPRRYAKTEDFGISLVRGGAGGVLLLFSLLPTHHPPLIHACCSSPFPLRADGLGRWRLYFFRGARL